jgi:hypothetical protein
MTIVYLITCNDCGDPIAESELSVKHARAKAKTNGAVSFLAKNTDYCDMCLEDRRLSEDDA